MTPLPLLIPLLKNPNWGKLFSSTVETKSKSSPSHSYEKIPIPASKQLPKVSLENQKQETVSLIRESIFQTSKMKEWRSLTDKEDPTVKEWKPVWNFLFPQVPWTKNRSYWKDDRKKRGWECFYSWEENLPKYFCIVFESNITGKIWLFFSYPYEEESVFRLDIQTEKQSTNDLLQKNFSKIAPLLTNVKEVEFHLATLANHLLCEEGSVLGVYA